MSKTRFQALRVTLADGGEAVFIAPLLDAEGVSPAQVVSLDRAYEFQCPDELRARDLWLLAQPGVPKH